MRRRIALLVFALVATALLAGCGGAGEEGAEQTATERSPQASASSDDRSPSMDTPDDAASAAAEADGQDTGSEASSSASERLDAILADQPDEVKARYEARNPAETLTFFGIEPGMTVVEALPGGGWYSKILLPYLGRDGTLIGANYPVTLFEQFEFATDEFMAELAGWAEAFPDEAAGWCDGDCASVRAFWLGDLPSEMEGTADVALFVRALHNMARFQNEGIDDFLDQALADAYAVLKPGGVLGIVQHAAPENMPEPWASGGAGYLKASYVTERAEAAGFVLEAESDVNVNPEDQPAIGDVVWRLAPTFGTTEEGTEERAAIEAIGESSRMTLRFRKPETGAED